MLIAICKSIINKPARDNTSAFYRLAYEFENVEVSQEELAKYINRGWAFTTQHTGGTECRYIPENAEAGNNHRCENGYTGQHRRAENFLAGQHIGLDFEGGISIEAVLEDSFIRNYHSIFYTTVNHKPEAPRFRIIFELDQVLTDAEDYRAMVMALMWKFDLGVDKACKDPCRIFYGSSNSSPVVTGKVLPVAVLVKLVDEWRKDTAGLEQAEDTPVIRRIGRATLEDIEDAGRAANGFLKGCRNHAWGAYDEWQRWAAWAIGLDRAFNSNSYFYDAFVQASRSHPAYNRLEDEFKLTKHFPKLKGKTQKFEGLGLRYDQATRRVADPAQPGFHPYLEIARDNYGDYRLKAVASSSSSIATGIATSQRIATNNGTATNNNHNSYQQQGQGQNQHENETTEEPDPFTSYAVHPSKLVHATELAKLPPVEWLVRNEIPKRALVVTFGPSGSGKSFVNLDYSLELAHTAPVVYVTAEGTSGYDQRVKAWCEYHEEDPGELYFYTDALNLMSSIETQAFIEIISSLQPVMVVIDTLAWCMATFGGDENSTKDMMIFLGNCNAIRRELGSTILITHHTGKAGSTERGSSSLKGGADTMIEVTAEEEIIKIDCIKQKDAPLFEARYVKRMDFAGSCVVVPAQPQDTINHASGKPSSKLLDILEKLNLSVFTESGAKAQQLISMMELSTKGGVAALYRNLSALKQREYISQGAKGDPYFITEYGKEALRTWRPLAT